MPTTRSTHRPGRSWPWVVAALATIALIAGALAGWDAAPREATAFSLIAALCLGGALAAAFASWRRERAESAGLGAEIAALEAMIATTPAAYYYWNLEDGSERASAPLAPLVGLSFADPDFTAVLGRFDENEGRKLSAALGALRAGGAGFAMTLAGAEDGRCFEAEGRAIGGNRPTAMVLWLRDISDSVAAVERAGAESKRLRKLLDALPIPVWRRGATLGLEYCNQAYASIVEADTTDAAAGLELVAEAEAEQAHALASKARADDAARSAEFHVVAGGERRLFNITEARFDGDDVTVGVAWDITDLEEARRNLDRHIAAHAEALESLSTAICVIGPDKQLRFCNSAYRKMWGFDDDWPHPGVPYGEILEVLRAKRRLPEEVDFPAFKKKREAMFTELIEAREELQYRPDGTTIRLVITPHPFGGLMFAFEDVTDALALERSLNTLIAVQRATLDNLYEGVAVFGSDGRLKLSNPGYAKLWKLSADQLDGEPHMSEVLDHTKDLYVFDGDWEEHKADIIARAAERAPSFHRLGRRDGSVLEWARFPLPDGAMLMTYLDITDSINVERALRERAEALEDADRLKSEFIANVSYELRTPLNTIIGFSELLSAGYAGDLDSRQSEYVRGILDSSQQLMLLISDILDLATIEAGRMELDIARFDLGAMLAGLPALARERVRAENIALELDWPDDLGEMVGDEQRIKQAVFQLLSNAIKFTPSGGAVTLKARRTGDDVAISVRDTGVGIPAEAQARVFDKFWRADGGRAPETGSGLGLSLVKSFVELHGGRVELASEVDSGTEITCYLPLEPGRETDQA